MAKPRAAPARTSERTKDDRPDVRPESESDPRFCLLHVLIDDDGVPRNYRLLETSPAFDRHAGVPSAVGMTARELIPSLPDEWPRLFLEVATSQRARQFYRQSEMDGKLLEVTAIPVGTPEQRRVAVTTVSVSEARTAEVALRRAHVLLEGIAEGTDDLIAAEDTAFRYTYFNEAYAREFKKLWGHDLSIGDDMVELLARWPTEQRKARDLWARALEGDSFRVEMAFGPTPEETRTYDLRFSPLRDASGEIVGAAHIFRDVTARVHVENKLREADRRKDEFLAMLGHELRTPLAAIQHATELLALRDHADAEIGRAAKVLDRQSAHMAQLIEGLLDVSRVAQGKITLTPASLELRALVHDVITDRAGQLAASNVVLVAGADDDAIFVTADRTRLTQIIDNLLGNAAKFTPPDGRITISVGQDRGEAVVRVRDTGPGIASEELEQVFEPFYQQPQAVPHARGGLGLGLALSRQLAELHGGTLQASDRGAEPGAEFVLRLPLTVEHRSTEPQASAEEPATAQRILIVEDNVDAAEMLSCVLRTRGHRAASVATGAEALATLAARPFDIVLCDVGLPDIDGYTLAAKLRENPATRHVTLVALTGYGQPEDRKRALEAGFNAHVTKPVSWETLAGLLRQPAHTSEF